MLDHHQAGAGRLLYETYGRTVRLVTVEASGGAADDAAARADAIRIADDVGAFAAIGGPSQTNAYADELAARGVLCLCVNSQPRESIMTTLINDLRTSDGQWGLETMCAAGGMAMATVVERLA